MRGFDDDTTVLATKCAVDFVRPISTEMDAQEKLTVAVTIEDTDGAVESVVFVRVRRAEIDLAEIVERLQLILNNSSC